MRMLRSNVMRQTCGDQSARFHARTIMAYWPIRNKFFVTIICNGMARNLTVLMLNTVMIQIMWNIKLIINYWEHGGESTQSNSSCSLSGDYFKRIEGAITSCQLPSPPEHAKFSCKVDRDLINEHDNELFIPDGTICKIKCARFFEISENLQRHASFACKIGRFNYTHHENFCTKIQKKFAW